MSSDRNGGMNQGKYEPSSTLSNGSSLTKDPTIPTSTYTTSNGKPEPSAAESKTSPPRSLSNFDAASTIAPSITTQGRYAPSSINNDERSLLSHSKGRLQSLQKTTGRKAYEGVCHVLEVWVPLDINEETTSMRDSSLLKLATGRRRSSGVKQDSRGPSRNRQGEASMQRLEYGLPPSGGGRR